jgi:hypothetical protein
MPQLGKRYICENCGTEVLCNKPGTGATSCCGKDMKLKEAGAHRGPGSPACASRCGRTRQDRRRGRRGGDSPAA